VKRFCFYILILTLVAGVALPVQAANRRGTEAAFNTWNVDQWGNITPSPHGYLPVASVPVPPAPQDLFFDEVNREIYLLTANQILVLDTDGTFLRYVTLTYNGVVYPTQRLTGIFVTRDGYIYLTDFDGGEIIKAARNGEIQRIFGEPVSDLIVPGTLFRPSKIVVDNFGRMYVQVFGVFEGIFSLSAEGEFINFFGANHVEMTFLRVLQQMWRRVLTLDQRRAMAAFVPIEYSNLFIDHEGFIFATVTTFVVDGSPAATPIGGMGGNTQLVRKLNPMGINVLPPQQTVLNNANFADVTVDRYGVITLIDRHWGYVFQTDESGRLLFAFGGLGGHLGMFSRPVAIIEVDENLWVLDEGKRNITIFEITEFGRNVHSAMRMHNEGRYVEGIDYWNRVIRYNANYLLAYQGLGRAYFQLEDFSTAMQYFRLAGDRAGYSDAFSEQSLIFMRANFGWVFLGIMMLTIAAMTRKVMKRRRRANP